MNNKRHFDSNLVGRMKKVHKKISKKVMCDGQEFESGRALGKYLGIHSNAIYRYIKLGNYKGKEISLVK